MMRKCRGVFAYVGRFLRQWKKEGGKEGGTENETLYLQQQYLKATRSSRRGGENKKRDEDRIQDRKIFLDFSESENFFESLLSSKATVTADAALFAFVDSMFLSEATRHEAASSGYEADTDTDAWWQIDKKILNATPSPLPQKYAASQNTNFLKDLIWPPPVKLLFNAPKLRRGGGLSSVLE